MKIACSSLSFAQEIRRGDLTQLDWLDLCANELELDGVVFEADHFPRTDADYLAQMKKAAADLGLTVAALAVGGAALPEGSGAAWLDVAQALGAPLLVVRAPQEANEPEAWGRFTETVKSLAGSAKLANVTLALRNGSATLCAATADLKRVAKDVDSAWLRFALDPMEFGVTDDTSELLSKTAIAVHTIDDLATFANAGDTVARRLIERLMRFRGFVTLDSPANRPAPTAFHEAIERFAALRALAFFPAVAK